MSRRLALALITLAAGAGLLAAAALGSGARVSSGGIFEVGDTGNLDSVDPAIANETTSWMFEAATGANLFRDSGGLVIPEVAKRFTVSKNGRVYRFLLRSGYRFSDGQAVRAASFAYAIKRSLNPDLDSPGGSYVVDQRGLNIVGALRYAAGRADSVSGVHASGLNLTIKLVRADPSLLTVLAMPFFQAASSKLPLTREAIGVQQVGDLPTAGPYTWSYNAPNQQANIVRNPYYTGTRGRHVDGVELDMQLDPETCFQETQASQLDLGCLPPGHRAAVAQQNGVSRSKPVGTGRFWIKSSPVEWTLLFNFRRLFAGNPQLRQAVSWALDRTAMADQIDPYAMTPWTHSIPPGFPGVVTAQRLQPYSLKPDLAKARQLAVGHMGDGSIHVAYQSEGKAGPLTAEAVRQALVGLGFDASRIEMRGFSGYDLYTAADTHGTPFDLVVGMGFGVPMPSADPASFVGEGLVGLGLGDFDPANASYNKAFHILSRTLNGKARLRALGRFDVQVMKNFAPVAVLSVSNDLTFFSDRVDPESLRYSPDYGWSFTALRLK
ncbi:MAG: ABC transporter substrate-binding protein [Actinobacteria bacterium]|nr:MAG: ABC transporter substrate-binding protein [Actinomycetota bacterium]